MAPFMADECLLAMPDVDSVEYTMKEYMSFVEHIKACVERLNQQGESNRVSDTADGIPSHLQNGLSSSQMDSPVIGLKV